MSFKKIQGQEKAIETLKNFIKSGRIPPALIFSGPAGVGKATCALEFAKTLNCLDEDSNKNIDNCSLCQNCKHIDAKTHPDIVFADFEYQANLRGEEVEKQQTIRVDTIRHLTALSQQKATLAKWKVFIIDNGEKLQAEGANAMLKFIEEPPANTLWILITSKREAMLSTIKSRCQIINFAPLSGDILLEILKDNMVEENLAKEALKYAQGSSETALRVSEVLEEFSSLDKGPAFAMQAARSLPKTLAQSRPYASCIIDMLVYKTHQNWLEARDEKQQTDLKELLNKLVFYKKALTRNVAPSLVVESAIIRAQQNKIEF